MLAVVAFTMTIVMVMGDFDLSVGSMASLAGVVAAVLFSRGLSGRPRGVAAALLRRPARRPAQRLSGQHRRHPALRRHARHADRVQRRWPSWSAAARRSSGRDIPQAFSGFARGGIDLNVFGDVPVMLPYLTLLALVVAARRLAAAGADGLRPPPLCDRRQLRGGAAGRRPGPGAAARGLRADRARRRPRRADVCQPRRLGQSDAGQRPHARRHRRRVPRHDHERGRRAARARHAGRRADPRRARQRPDADERRQLRPGDPGRHASSSPPSPSAASAGATGRGRC